MRVFEAVSELLRRSDLRVVFGLFGSANVAWVGHGVQTGVLHWVRTRHEGTAVAAAVAYSRVTGKLGVATTTLGPGFANTVNSLAAAVHDHVPVLLVVGQSPSGKRHGDFQTLNQHEIVDAIGAGFHQASRPHELEAAYWAALRAAHWNGLPQVLSIDEAMLADEIVLSEERPLVDLRPTDEPDPGNVVAAVDLLATASKPVVLAGQGALLAGCRDELVELAELIGARLATTLNANRSFSGHAADLGVCGKSASPATAAALYETDVVFAVGASLNSYTTGDGGIFPSAKIIQCEIDIDQDFKASAPELGLLGDAGACVRAVLAEWRRRDLPARPVTGSVPSREEMVRSVLDVDLGHDPARGLDLRTVYATLDKKLPPNRIVVTDGGRAGKPLPALVDAPDGRSWLPSRGYGSIGLGIGASIGAAVGQPERPVVLFCGDGGFMMAAQELDTIRLHDLDVTIVVMNDSQYGSEIKYLNKFGLDLAVAQQSMPDLVLLSRAFGGTCLVVETEDDLGRVQLPRPGLHVIEARIDPEVDPANL